MTFEAGAPKASGDPSPYLFGDIQHIAYRGGGDSQIRVAFIKNSGKWVVKNVGSEAEAPPAATGPRAYLSKGIQHLAYVDEGKKVRTVFTGVVEATRSGGTRT